MAWRRKDERPLLQAEDAQRFGRQPAPLGQVLGGLPAGSVRAAVAGSLLSTEQLARRCKVDRQTVVRWVINGCPSIGGRGGEPLRFEFEHVEAWRKASGR
jgi:hypothetical protein